MSYRLTIEDIEDYKKRPAIYKQRAIMHICANRGMTKADLKKYGYTTIRTREEIINEKNTDTKRVYTVGGIPRAILWARPSYI